jgi:hypothetical protein
MLLRKESLGKYSVVGQCFQDGLETAEGLLGHLPNEFVMQMRRPNGIYLPFFIDMNEGKVREEDPRLGKVPDNWVKLDFTPSQDDPIHAVKYRNEETGEILNSDPRLRPDTLRSRGVQLQTFRLV